MKLTKSKLNQVIKEEIQQMISALDQTIKEETQNVLKEMALKIPAVRRVA